MWLHEYMDSGNATRSALKVYYPDFPSDKVYSEMSEEEKKTHNAAATIGWENLRKLDIEITDLMDEAGLTDVYLVKKLRENMEATRLYGKSAIEHMDGSTRNKALEMSLKMKGKLKEKIDVSNPDGSLSTATEVVAATLLAIYERNPVTQTSQAPEGSSGGDSDDNP